MWSFTVHNTITGAPLLPVKAASGRWSRVPGSGSGEHVVQLLDADEPVPRSVAQSIARPNECTLAVAWNGVVVYAGLIVVGRYARNSGTLLLRHSDIRTLFKERLTFGVTSYALGDLSMTGKTTRALVRGIVDRAVYHWANSTWRLPIDLPDDAAGAHDLVVKNWEWATIEDLLQRVEKIGVTIDFDPYYTSDGSLRWATRVGGPWLPGNQFEWVATAADTPVTNLEVELDGTAQLSGCFYMGKGAEADMRVGEAGFIGGPTIPVRDAARSAKDESDTAKLNEMALTDLQKNRSARRTTSFDLVADGSWNVGNLKPGARVRLITSGDAFIDDGSQDLVVTGVSGDMSHVLKPEVQPL